MKLSESIHDEYSAMTVNSISDKAIEIIKSAIGHHLDTVANNYDAWFAVYDYLPDTSENCPNCADQASIAAPGQTVLCKTHNKENEERLEKQHYAEMKEFFIEEIERITFRPHLPFCSCCGKQTSQYVGIIQSNSSGPLSFSFCIDCRDELTLKQNAARAALEKIGA